MNLPAGQGFAVSNCLSTGADSGFFFRALLGKDQKILNSKTRKEMMKLRWLETGIGNKVSSGQFYGMGVRDLSAQLALNPVHVLSNPEIYFAGLLYGHDGASIHGFHSWNAYSSKYDTGLSFIMNDVRAAQTSFNFVARKVYDITSGLTPPVMHPLR